MSEDEPKRALEAAVDELLKSIPEEQFGILEAIVNPLGVVEAFSQNYQEKAARILSTMERISQEMGLSRAEFLKMIQNV